MLPSENFGRSHHNRLQSGSMGHCGGPRGNCRLPGANVSVEQSVHRHLLLIVMEDLSRRAPLGLCELEAETRFEGVPDVLSIRDRDRWLARDSGTHECKCGLQLE